MRDSTTAAAPLQMGEASKMDMDGEWMALLSRYFSSVTGCARPFAFEFTRGSVVGKFTRSRPPRKSAEEIQREPGPTLARKSALGFKLALSCAFLANG